MKCINFPLHGLSANDEGRRGLLKPLCAATVLMLLSACSTFSDSDVEEPQVATQDSAQQQQPVEPVFDPYEGKSDEYKRLMQLPNAYKENAVTVPNEVRVKVQQAMATKESDVFAAKVSLENVAAANPQLSGVFVQLGDIELELGNNDKARDYYTRAVQANDNNYFAHNRLGLMQRQAGDFTGAKASYEAALNAWGAFAQAHLNLGILLDMYMGQKRQALQHYQTYQVLTEEKNNKVKGWIADISMQLKQ